VNPYAVALALPGICGSKRAETGLALVSADNPTDTVSILRVPKAAGGGLFISGGHVIGMGEATPGRHASGVYAVTAGGIQAPLATAFHLEYVVD